MFIGWSSSEKQRICHQAINEELSFESSLLDVGCGVGDFSTYVNNYIGIDNHQRMIEEAIKKYPDKKFILSSLDDYSNSHDVVIACGVFNVLVNDNLKYIMESAEKMASLAIKKVIFTLLSRHSETKQEGLYYYNPGEIFNKMKHRFQKVILRHDYLPDDFLISIIK